jgi:hypothetical protein
VGQLEDEGRLDAVIEKMVDPQDLPVHRGLGFDAAHEGA